MYSYLPVAAHTEPVAENVIYTGYDIAGSVVILFGGT